MHDVAHLTAAGAVGMPAVERSPQHPLGEAGGLFLRHLHHLGGILRIGDEELRIELGLHPGLHHVRALLDEVGAHSEQPAIVLLHALAGRDQAREAVPDQARGGGLPHHRRIELAGAEVGGDHLDVLVQVLLRLDLEFLEGRLCEAVGAASFRHGDGLAVEPADRVLVVLELRRVVAHEEGVALVPRQPEHADQPDIGDLGLRGGDNPGHVAVVADVLLAGEHVVDDDRALQADLELDVRALRQILFVELLAAHHHA